jgi:hypothetical protein
MEPAETVEVVADLGFAGCAHARKNSNRQVLLVDKETLDAMELVQASSVKILQPKD